MNNTVITHNILEGLQKQLQGKPLDIIEEMHLDDFPLIEIPELLSREIEKCKNLLILSFNNCQLNTLENLPNLPKLLRLEIDSNPINPDTFKHLNELKTLTSLSMGSNPSLMDFNDLLPIVTNVPNLQQIDLMGCPISEQKFYRRKIFEIFPKLQFLDNLDIKGSEIRVDQTALLSEEEKGDDLDEKSNDSFQDNKRKKVKKS